MKRNRYYIWLLLLIMCCREKYVPRLTSPSTGYLVVEGIINSGSGATTIRLSRTSVIGDNNWHGETGASVLVVGSDGSASSLVEMGTNQKPSFWP